MRIMSFPTGPASLLLIAILSLFIACGCSASDPSIPQQGALPDERSTDAGGRCVIACFDCIIGPGGAFEMVPNRVLETHYNVNPFVQPPACNDCVAIQPLEFKPALGYVIAAVTLKNPTDISAYDVRGILISDNGHDVFNRDGYTTMYDTGGPVERNPFIWFTSDAPFSGYSSITKIFYLELPQPLNFQFTYVVDVSFPAHCREPYYLRGYVTEGLTGAGGEAEIAVYAKDWQDNVDSVTAETDELNGSETTLVYDTLSDSWRGTVSNTEGQPEGDYSLWVWAESMNSGPQRIYQKLEYTVGSTGGLADGWPLERGDWGGTGSVPANGPSDGELKWTYPFTGYDWDGASVITPIGNDEGTTYVALDDELFAIDINGDLLWSFPVTSVTASFTPALRYDDVVIWPVNREIGGFEMGFVYFIDTDGNEARHPGLLPGLVTAPAIFNHDGKLVIPIDNGIWTCESNGYGIWQYIPSSGEMHIPRIASLDTTDSMYLVTDYGSYETLFISLDKFGVERWNIPLNGGPLSQAIIGESDAVYAVSTLKDFSQAQKFGIQARNGIDGSAAWGGTYSNYKGLTSFAIAMGQGNSRIYATHYDGSLVYSVTADEGLAADTYAPLGMLGDNASAPSVDGSGRVFAGGQVTVLSVNYSVFSALDSNLEWEWEYLEEGNGFIGSPVLSTEHYVFCMGLSSTDKLGLYCFGEK